MLISYTASPTAAKFHASEKVVRGFMGPVGNGKSVCCIMEGLGISADQWPNSQGIRKSRGIIVRNTGPELRTTTIKTWKQWIPESVAPIVMHPVMTCTFEQDLDDGTKIEMEVIFMGLDKDGDVAKLLSLEPTWIFLNEARELPYSIVKGARERIGRYPARIDGYEDVWKNGKLIYDAPKVRNPDGSPALDENGEIQYTPCKRKALLMDTNPPDDDHWWYQLAEEGGLRREDGEEIDTEETNRVFDFFRGPPALIKTAQGYVPNPNAENISNLPGGYQYYIDMIAGSTSDHINVMVLGNYGVIQEGRLVYPDYNDSIHCPEDYVKAKKGLPIGLGWDFGLYPSCVIGQLTEQGQLRVVAELCGPGMGIRRFARDVVRPFLHQHFKDYEIAFSYGDPANPTDQGYEHTPIGILNDEYEEKRDKQLRMGFVTEPAPSNSITKRVDAVSQFMVRMVHGQPAYLLNKACKMLRKGKQGGYILKRLAVIGKEEMYKEEPDKNKYSHPADAEQYMALGFLEYGEVLYEDDDDYEPPRAAASAIGY